MDETKVQIGEDVLLDIGIHSDWYISAICYYGESVNVELSRKTDRNKEWWLADTPQTDLVKESPSLVNDLVEDDKCFDCEDFFDCDEHQTDCPWK